MWGYFVKVGNMSVRLKQVEAKMGLDQRDFHMSEDCVNIQYFFRDETKDFRLGVIKDMLFLKT